MQRVFWLERFFTVGFTQLPKGTPNRDSMIIDNVRDNASNCRLEDAQLEKILVNLTRLFPDREGAHCDDEDLPSPSSPIHSSPPGQSHRGKRTRAAPIASIFVLVQDFPPFFRLSCDHHVSSIRTYFSWL